MFFREWSDAWSLLKPNEDGFTYDGKLNKMLQSRYRNRLDRVFFRSSHLKIQSIEVRSGSTTGEGVHVAYHPTRPSDLTPAPPPK